MKTRPDANRAKEALLVEIAPAPPPELFAGLTSQGERLAALQRRNRALLDRIHHVPDTTFTTPGASQAGEPSGTDEPPEFAPPKSHEAS